MAEGRIVEGEGGCLRLEGELSFATVPAMVGPGIELVGGCPRGVVVDLGGVRRADSAGLALMVEWMRAARRHGKDIVFRNMPAQMQAMARVSELHHILPLE